MRADPTTSTDFAVHVAPLAEGGTEVAVFGELDAATAPKLREALGQAIDAPGEVVIDMRACSFVDSMGIAVLAGAAARLREAGRHLTIFGIKDRVLRTFEVAGLAAGPSITIETERPGPRPEGPTG